MAFLVALPTTHPRATSGRHDLAVHDEDVGPAALGRALVEALDRAAATGPSRPDDAARWRGVAAAFDVFPVEDLPRWIDHVRVGRQDGGGLLLGDDRPAVEVTDPAELGHLLIRALVPVETPRRRDRGRPPVPQVAGCSVLGLEDRLVVAGAGIHVDGEAWGGWSSLERLDREVDDEELGRAVRAALDANRYLTGAEAGAAAERELELAGVRTAGQLSRRAARVDAVLDAAGRVTFQALTPQRYGWSGPSRGEGRPLPGAGELGRLVREALVRCPSWAEAHPPRASRGEPR